MGEENQQSAISGQPSAGSGLLDLAAPERSAVVRFREKKAIHVFRRLTMEDWLSFYSGMQHEELQTGALSKTSTRLHETIAALWEAVVLRVEGYKAGADWKERMPLAHKLAAVLVLRQVNAANSGNPFDLESDQRLITLEATWNSVFHGELVHVFKDPSQEDQLEWNRSISSFYRVRGSRGRESRIRFPVNFGKLCRLYDQLILEVRGYAFTGTIQTAMDALHKEVAIGALFQPVEQEPETALEAEIKAA